MVATDSYVQCADETCADSELVVSLTPPELLSVWMTGETTTTLDDEQNWYTPVVDNDLDEPFCTPLPNDDANFGLYKCKAIKCLY